MSSQIIPAGPLHPTPPVPEIATISPTSQVFLSLRRNVSEGIHRPGGFDFIPDLINIHSRDMIADLIYIHYLAEAKLP